MAPQRLAWPIVLLLVLATPTAVAADDLDEVADEKGLVKTVVDTLAPVADKSGDVAAGAAGATASGAKSAASGLGALVKALGRGVVAAADAAGDAAVATGRAIVDAGVAIGHAFVATMKFIGTAAVVTFRFLASAASLAWTGVVAVAAALWSLALTLGGLAAKGARFVAEHPRESLYVAGGAGAAASGYGLWTWLKRIGAFAPLTGLYTRIAKSDILRNKVRARIFEMVKAEPGLHPSALKDELGVGWGTIVYHLDKLEETGLLIARKAGGQKCYFVNGGALDPRAQRAAAALKHPKAHDIAAFVLAHPDASQKEVAESLGISSALVSWHVKRLVKAGVLDQQRTGAGSRLRLCPGTESALAA